MPGVEIGVSVIDASATTTFQQITAAEGKMEQGAKKVTDQYKHMGLSVKKLYRETRTPSERHNQRMKELDRLLKANRIDQDLYNRSVKRSEDAMRRAGDAGKSAFGDGLKGKVTALAGAFTGGMGLVALVQAFKQYAGEAHEEVKGIAEAMKGAEEGQKRLWQIAKGKEEYRGLSAKVKLAMAQQGLDRNESAALAFSLKSAGLEDKMKPIAATKRFMDPAVSADFYAMMSATYGKDKYTVPQAMSGLLVGAEKSSFDAQQTAKFMKETLPDAKALGAGPGEVAGIGAALSYQYSSPEKMTTGARALMKELTKWREGQLAKGVDVKKLGEGILGTFDAMRQLDPKHYKERKLSELEFAGFARRLEDKRAEAGQMVETTRAAFTGSGEQYRRKINVPYSLGLLQQSRVAALQREVVQQPKAEAQIRLKNRLDQIAALTGGGGVEHLYEDALDTGAKYGFVRKSQEYADERALDTLRRRHPQLFKKHFPDVKPYDRYVAGMGGMGGRETGIDLEGPMTPQQEQRFRMAMSDVAALDVQRQNEAAAKLDEAADKMLQAAEAQQRAAENVPLANPAVQHNDRR